MLEQLIALFPELEELDLEEAVEQADNQVQELIGQLETLAEAVGLDADTIADRLLAFTASLW